MPCRAVNPLRFGLLWFLVLIIPLGGLGAASAHAQPARQAPPTPAPKSILLVYSAGYHLPAYRKNIAAFMSVMEKTGFPTNNIFFEYLDLIRNSTQEYRQLLYDLLHEKYANKKIDLIVTVEGVARDFILDAAKDIFPGTPILSILAADVIDKVDPSRRVVQIPSILDMAGTLQVALSLFPQTKRAFIVLGSREDEQRWELDARKQFSPWLGKLAFEYSSSLTYEETLQRVASLPPETIVIYIALYSDKTGRAFVPAEVAKAVATTANMPVFGIYDQILGLVLGGAMLSYEAEGARAAQLALDILNDKFPLSEPLTTLPLLIAPKFNWQQLKHWGVSARRLPDGSVIINKPASIWDDYKDYVIGFVALIALQAGMIILLLAMHRRRIKAELDRNLAEARYRRIVELANEGIWVVDSSLRITFVNQQMADMLGYPPEEITGQSIDSFVYPEDMEAHTLSMAKRRQGLSEEYERRWVRKDGKVIWTMARATPLLDDQGGFSGSFGMFNDITERKQAEEELRHSQAFTSSIIASSADGIMVLGLDGRLKYISPSGLHMLAIEDLSPFLDRPYEQFWSESDLEGVRLALATAGQGGRGSFQGFCPTTTGEPKWWDVTVTPIMAGDGRVESLLAVSRDITERRRAEEERRNLEAQLRQAQKMEAIGTLAGGIAHDFNNILAAIMGYAELAQDSAQGRRDNGRELEEILAAAQRARDLVKQILTFSRKVEPQLRPLDLNQEVRRSLELMQHTLPKMIAIEHRLAPDLRRVNADPGQLSQVLMNLAANAFQAMPDGGQLTITTENVSIQDLTCLTCGETFSGDWALLSVSDTGQGIDPETLPRIFDPFFTTKDVGQGTGLGLSMVHGIIRSHRGHIECVSQLGRGTTFKIYLPGLQASPAEAGQDQSTPSMQGGSETILLVDDEEALRHLGQRILTSMGYQVLTAPSGEEALRAYHDQGGRIDLVVLDLGMPGMGGHKALLAILAANPRAKVIIASGYAANGQVKASLEAGAVGYVAKPFRRAELLLAVRGVLDKS